MLTKVGRANSKAFEGDQPSGLKRCHSISNRPEVCGQVQDQIDYKEFVYFFFILSKNYLSDQTTSSYLRVESYLR